MVHVFGLRVVAWAASTRGGYAAAAKLKTTPIKRGLDLRLAADV
jgi:hypothetical protein